MTIKIYIAGPITGIANNNSEAFQGAEDFLSGLGLSVVNPLKNGLVLDAPWVEHMKVDIQNMIRCDAVYALKGWHNSKGARAEVHLAEVLDMPIFEQCEKDNIKLALFKPKAAQPVLGGHHLLSDYPKEALNRKAESMSSAFANFPQIFVPKDRGNTATIPPVFPHQTLENAYGSDKALCDTEKDRAINQYKAGLVFEDGKGLAKITRLYDEAEAMFFLIKKLTPGHFIEISDFKKEADRIVSKVEGL